MIQLSLYTRSYGDTLKMSNYLSDVTGTITIGSSLRSFFFPFIYLFVYVNR